MLVLANDSKLSVVTIGGVCYTKDDDWMRKAVSDMKQDYITDEQVIKRANAAVELEIEKLKALDAPVIVYDRKRQIVVRRNNDGTEVEVAKRLRKGHYSERIAKET